MPELFAAQFILGCIFLTSSIGKFSSLHTFADEILNYQLISGNLAQVVAYVLPFVEFTVGLLFITGFLLVPNSILAILLLLIFTGAIIINLIRGRRFSCHCFGNSRAMIGPAATVRNFILGALALWIFFNAPKTFDLSALVSLWRSNIQQLVRLNTIAPLVATIILSLSILFLLSEIDTLLHENRTLLT